jgi:hypothetical protein
MSHSTGTCITDQRIFGHRRDPSYRRGLHEGACLALRLADEGWPRDVLTRWLTDVGEWRYDDEAGPLPPEPKPEGGRGDE